MTPLVGAAELLKIAIADVETGVGTVTESVERLSRPVGEPLPLALLVACEAGLLGTVDGEPKPWEVDPTDDGLD